MGENIERQDDGFAAPCQRKPSYRPCTLRNPPAPVPWGCGFQSPRRRHRTTPKQKPSYTPHPSVRLLGELQLVFTREEMHFTCENIRDTKRPLQSKPPLTGDLGRLGRLPGALAKPLPIDHVPRVPFGHEDPVDHGRIVLHDRTGLVFVLAQYDGGTARIVQKGSAVEELPLLPEPVHVKTVFPQRLLRQRLAHKPSRSGTIQDDEGLSHRS